jgi:predicted RNA polymerase sigma factor
MTARGEAVTHRAIERVARESYGRLVAYLAAHTRDVASAEDALSEALVAALTAWPRDGVPRNPAAWLLTTARHAIIDLLRHQQVVWASEPTLLALTGDHQPELQWSARFPDDRLTLLFVCAHPAIDPAMHTPLMLQTVLGLDAACIAQAFLVSPTTMGQRLVRAKTKIRDGGLPFAVPHEREVRPRLAAVLDAIYAAFGIGWDAMVGAEQRGRDLAEEALWLARVLLDRMPEDPEVRGLLALMLHCDARRPARRGADGRYIPLSEQDPHQWILPLLAEAETQLAAASTYGRSGRFQLEAAIQSVHAERGRSGRTAWGPILRFYEQLVRLSPTIGAHTGYAAAAGAAHGPAAGLAVLDRIAPGCVAEYQPYWAVRAHLLQQLGRLPESQTAFDRAIGLAEDPAVRQFLLGKRGEFSIPCRNHRS